MKDGFKVIDADRHVLEPSDLFEKYLPEKFRSRVEIKGPNQAYRLVDGQKISDADKLRDTSKQEDVGFTFGGSRRWRETFAEALAAKGKAGRNPPGKNPAIIFKRQCWASCEAGEELAPVCIDHVGDDYLLVATDYPHSDCIGKFPDRTVGDLTKNDRIAKDARRKILWDNPQRLYSLEV